jgi:hypothetical protein
MLKFNGYQLFCKPSFPTDQIKFQQRGGGSGKGISWCLCRGQSDALPGNDDILRHGQASSLVCNGTLEHLAVAMSALNPPTKKQSSERSEIGLLFSHKMFILSCWS